MSRFLCPALLLLAALGPCEAAPEPLPTAPAILERALQLYRSARTYQDRWSMRFDIQVDEKGTIFPGEDQEHVSDFAFERPNKLSLDLHLVRVQCDGRKLWLASEALKQYTETTAPATLDLDKALPDFVWMTSPLHPIAKVMTSPAEPIEKLYPQLGPLTTARSEGGCYELTGPLKLAGMPNQAPATVKLRFDRATGLLRECRLDLLELYRKSSRQFGPAMKSVMPEVEEMRRVELTMRFEDPEIDLPVPPEKFGFTPPDGLRQVEALILKSGGGTASDSMIGKPAPEVSGKDLDGRPVASTAWKGRVVALAFWSTWWAPSVQALPRIQAIARRFRAKPVTILGVSRDPKPERVRAVVRKKKATFRQLIEGSDELTAALRVVAIPTVVLIDSKGVVQSLQPLDTPGAEEKLVTSIRKLLAGEDLFDRPE